MNARIFFRILLLLLVITLQSNAQKNGLDRSAFYNSMASDNLEVINAQLDILKNASVSEKEAYEGALLMKKAGLMSKAKEKLSFFKSGRIKLEAAIKKESANAEYNFLRLIIQEHAPKVVNYRGNLEADDQVVRSNFKSLPPVLQKAILDYSKKSKFLKAL